ncbi:MAG: hypothetical protein K0R17_2271 [Rariglobus sp.]|nr:hypothetical protein [Rariglobus sp.]
MNRRTALCFLFALCTAIGSAQEETTAIVTAARTQIGVTVLYDPSYVVLTYPGGDIPADRGVCTDVVIRALRTALMLDLQKEVHTDMKANFTAYPKNWGLSKPDKNIDHRRVPNLQTYLTRHARFLGISNEAGDYLPGDLVTSMLPGNRPHIMIVSDRKNKLGVPLVIHNIGDGTKEDASLFAFPITGHYRVKIRKPTTPTASAPRSNHGPSRGAASTATTG